MKTALFVDYNCLLIQCKSFGGEMVDESQGEY